MVELKRHPNTSGDAVQGIDVAVSRAGGILSLTFRLRADLDRIRVPPQRAPAVVHELWKHTCFEVFIAREGSSEYFELNLSPSSEWAGYQFRDYREIAGLVDEGLAPRIAVRIGTDGLQLATAIQLALLAPALATAGLDIGLSAVIEDRDGRLSYWALNHPAAQADFHHRDTRTLRLEPSAS